ncbi:MAG TPA: PA2779 family protein [Terriglobales bacterium]|nr:PA2779 family protein [Terriglobales bacterium]
MHCLLRQFVRVAAPGTLAVICLIPQEVLAQSHVVSPSDLQKAAVASSQGRERNVEALQEFVSTPAAEKALKAAHIDSQQVKNAVSRLSDDELAQLAARADKAQKEFAAGTLSDRDLIIILLAIVALILIIVAVR